MPAAVAATVPYEPLAVLHGVPFVHAQLDRLDGRGRQADVRRPRFVFRDAEVRDDKLGALQRISPVSDPAPTELLVRVGVRRVVAQIFDPRAGYPVPQSRMTRRESGLADSAGLSKARRTWPQAYRRLRWMRSPGIALISKLTLSCVHFTPYVG